MTNPWLDTIHRLPLAHEAAALEGLQHRYQSLNAMASYLPPTLHIPEGLETSKLTELATSIPQQGTSPRTPIVTPAKGSADTSVRPSKSPPDIIVPAFTLALFGWQAEEDHIPGLATCTACFRRLGLWLFKPSSDDPDSQSSMDRLDVIGEHREYCPWVNVLSQNGVSRRSSLDGLAGWEVLLRHVRNRVIHRSDEMKEKRGEAEKENIDSASEVASIIGTDMTDAEEKAAMDQKDEERWAKLKRLKQVFQVKRKSGRAIRTTNAG